MNCPRVNRNEPLLEGSFPALPQVSELVIGVVAMSPPRGAPFHALNIFCNSKKKFGRNEPPSGGSFPQHPKDPTQHQRFATPVPGVTLVNPLEVV